MKIFGKIEIWAKNHVKIRRALPFIKWSIPEVHAVVGTHTRDWHTGQKHCSARRGDGLCRGEGSFIHMNIYIYLTTNIVMEIVLARTESIYWLERTSLCQLKRITDITRRLDKNYTTLEILDLPTWLSKQISPCSRACWVFPCLFPANLQASTVCKKSILCVGHAGWLLEDHAGSC